MTTISAKIIADSIGVNSPRLTTLHLRYPRFIHAELMTHRVFSRNARSSRAVPIEKMILEIEADPVIPLHWGAAQKGMQADQECSEPIVDPFHMNPLIKRGTLTDRKRAWLRACSNAVASAKAFAEAGYHKQVVNRLLEPFMHIDVLVTATEWENFFALRDHIAAEPHFQMLARAIRTAMNDSNPRVLQHADWHMPYISDDDWRLFPQDLIHGGDGFSYDEAVEGLLTMSVARCARISYVPFDGSHTSPEAERRRYELLRTSGHWSPFEHQATPDDKRDVGGVAIWFNSKDHGNLDGWRQNRRIVERAA